MVSVGDCATVHPGQHILEHAYNQKGNGIGYLTGPADFGDISPTIRRWTTVSKAWTVPGDVLVTVKGAGVGKANLSPSDRVAIGRQLMAIRPSSRLSQRYLFFYLKHVFKDFQRAAIGATVPGLGRNDIESLVIPLPPLHEQERIAVRLTEQLALVDRARAAAQSRLTAAEALPAVYLREAFEGANWPIMELRDGLRAIEAGTSVQSLERPARHGEWGVLKVSAVSWGKFKAEENKAVPPGFAPKPHEHVRAGDLLISRANTQELVGAVVMVHEAPERLMLSDKTLRLLLRNDVLRPEFFEYAIRTPGARKFIEHNATGTSYSMRNISQETIRAIPLPVPPVADQKRIAADLSHRLVGAQRLTKSIGDELTAIDALPAALLRSAFGEQTHAE